MALESFMKFKARINKLKFVYIDIAVGGIIRCTKKEKTLIINIILI